MPGVNRATGRAGIARDNGAKKGMQSDKRYRERGRERERER